MVEATITFTQEFTEIIFAEAAADKRPHDAKSHFMIRQAGKSPNVVMCHLRPVFRYIEAAIAGKAGEEDIFK